MNQAVLEHRHVLRILKILTGGLVQQVQSTMLSHDGQNPIRYEYNRTITWN